jgi:hypothetical protein
MKVDIGPYSQWFGPYQLAALLQYVGVSETTCDKIGDKLNSISLIQNFFEWFDRTFKKRRINIKIHDYDVWSMDDTLALIILPMLKLLREKKHGYAIVDDADVPEQIRSTSAPPLTQEQIDTACPDNNGEARWNWVIDEMIWAFEQVLNDDAESQFHYDLDPSKPRNEPGLEFEEMMSRGGYDRAGYIAWAERKTRGFALFGKYFEALWD